MGHLAGSHRWEGLAVVVFDFQALNLAHHGAVDELGQVAVSLGSDRVKDGTAHPGGVLGH